jgi:hypothetical protein
VLPQARQEPANAVGCVIRNMFIVLSFP